jgi:hypothetical protein
MYNFSLFFIKGFIMVKIVRKESYNHRTTAQVEWVVYFNDFIIATCSTKKEAKLWAELYSTN